MFHLKHTAAMDGGDMYSEGVSTLWSVSTKFAREMQWLHLSRPLVQASVSYTEHFAFLTKQNYKVYGSRGEGIFYPLEITDHKDIDYVCAYPKPLAVEIASANDLNDQETYVYRVDIEGCLPGYCKLRQLHHGSSYFYYMHITKECNGINYLLNTWPRHLIKMASSLNSLTTQFPVGMPDFALGPMAERGPTISREFRGYRMQSNISPLGFTITKQDNVLVISHPEWHSCASEWRDRIRCYGWPSQQQIQNITNKGIYLAPVGSIQSEHQDIQWRYSFNEAERELVRSFNSTQISCYVLLKMLVSKYITQHFGDDVISSYHIKTLMFWAVEQTEQMLWVSRNLVELVFRILNVLLDCVAKLYCPSYFIPDENLFAVKITSVNREPVSQILLQVMNEGWVALTRLKPFDKNEDFIQSLYEDNDIVDLEELEGIRLRDEYITKLLYYYGSGNRVDFIIEMLYPISCCSLIETYKMHENFNQVVNELLQRIHFSDNDRNKEMLQNILAFVRCIYGTHFLSLSRCPSLERRDNCIMEKIGLVYTSHACKSNLVECIAKHANYTYMTGDFQTTIEAANQLLDRYARFPLLPQGVARNFNALLDVAESTFVVDTVIYGRNVSDLFDKHCFLGWIIFLKNELYALPGDARVELFYVISTGNQLQTICRNWFGLSPFLYVAYLAFLINMGRGFEQESEFYLKSMESICRRSNSFESSSINLLGASYINSGQHETAMKMFRISWKRQREETNSVVWHIARLLWRKLRGRWMETS